MANVGVDVWRYTLLQRSRRGGQIDPRLLDANDAVYRVSVLLQFAMMAV